MRTAKQNAASRANGQKSQGPTTTEGKANSRFNALKHGIHAESQIMFDETAEDLAGLAAELHEEYAPANATERFLVDTLVHNEWRLRRMRTIEASLWQTGVDSYLDKHTEMQAATSGDAFTTCAPAFERLQRIVNCCERNYHRALKALHSLQLHAPAEEPVAAGHAQPSGASQTAQSTTTSESSGSFRNNPEPPAAAPPESAPQAAPTPINQAKRPFPTFDEFLHLGLDQMGDLGAALQAAHSQR